MNRRSFLATALAAPAALIGADYASSEDKTVAAIATRPGMKLQWVIPDDVGKVVGLIQFNGHLVLACEKSLFYFKPEDFQ